MGPRGAIAQNFAINKLDQLNFDTFSEIILDAVLRQHNIARDANFHIYRNPYARGYQYWWVGRRAGDTADMYLGRTDPVDWKHATPHMHIPLTPAIYDNGHKGSTQPNKEQLILRFDADHIKDERNRRWGLLVQGEFWARGGDAQLCENINNSLQPLRDLGAGSRKKPFIPTFQADGKAWWGPYKLKSGEVGVGQIPPGTYAYMFIPQPPEAMAFHFASAAWNSQWAQGAYRKIDKALSRYESWGHFKSQGGNFRASGVGGFAGEVANQYGYGRAALAIGLGADVIGGYAAGGFKGVASNLGATAVQMGTQYGVAAYLGGNEMQAEGAGRLAGLATASLSGPQGAITYGVSTVGSDIGSIAASYASARKNGMSSGTFVGETMSNYKTYFWQYFGY